MVAVDAVAADEAFKDMEALGRENVDATVLEEIGGRVGRILDETGVHEVL